ncbi:MAG: MFS transporter [Chryseobacterium sp.]|uniref:MFS transporter n=1 Tax=Chryseobacterium sp. TaxID=1871047 RepID=UPI0025B8D3B4|nr:MFS transporter [Chryseobacterium sp.]MCJ7933366.1 MFS transporter [Chryseobacterium sp.]
MKPIYSLSLKNGISLLLISMSVFLCVLDLFIVNIAIPSIRENINANEAESQFIIVFYIIGYGAFLITGSKFGIKYGHKKVFVRSMLGFMLFSFFCGIAQSPLQLNTSRLFQGITAAFMVPQGVALIADIFQGERERSKALGIYGAVAGSASVLGQVLGGIIPDMSMAFEAWRIIFLINVPLALATALLAAKLLHEIEPKKKETIQNSSQTALIILLVLLIYQIIIAGEEGWNRSTISIAMLPLTGLIYFIYRQSKDYHAGKNVLISMKPFTYSSFGIAVTAAAAYCLVQDAYFFINASYFQEHLLFSSSKTGSLFAFQGIGYVIASLFGVKYLHHYQERFMALGLILMVACLFLHIYFLNGPGVRSTTVAVILFFYGTGCGIVLPSMFTNAMHQLPPGVTSVASGIYLTVQQISIALGVSILGRIYFNTSNGYHTATLSMIVLLGITFLIFGISMARTFRTIH